MLGKAFLLRPREEVVEMHRIFKSHLTSGGAFSVFYAIQSVVGTQSAFAGAKHSRYPVPSTAMIANN